MKEKKSSSDPLIAFVHVGTIALAFARRSFILESLDSSMSTRAFRTVTRALPTRSRVILPASRCTLRYNSTLSQGPEQPRTLSEIHYHLIQSRVAVSYLPEAPESLKASTYIGSLPVLEDEEPGLNDFEPNRERVR